MSDCLFCKIIKGDIPSIKVYEDEHVYAFMNIAPVTKGHILLIPKTHCVNLFDMPEDVAANLYKVAPKLANALKTTFNCVGMNTLNNNEAAAGQTVFHYHLHFIPRYDERDGIKVGWETFENNYPIDVLQAVAEEIKENLN